MPRTIELYQQFRGRCQLAFGIGTNLTNDLGEPAARARAASDRHQDGALQRPAGGQAVRTPRGKNMCDDEKYLAYLRQVFEIPNNRLTAP